MKRFVLYCLFLSVSTLAIAQERVTPLETEGEKAVPMHYTDISPMPLSPLYNAPLSDSLHLPALNYYGQISPSISYPYSLSRWNEWELHQGLNVNMGLSVFTQFGKNSYHGVGFSQNISAMYALPVTTRLSLAIGGYFNHMHWQYHSFKDAGLSAVLGYQFNERWSAYVYGQKAFVKDKYFPRPLYDIHALGDRIGAAVRYNFSPSFYMEVSVETQKMPTTEYHKQYDYPVSNR